MKFEKGKQYECMWSQSNCFKVGEVYRCHMKGYIIDRNGELQHQSNVSSRFRLHEHEPKLGEKVLVWDDDEKMSVEYLFFTKADGQYPYVVFEGEINYGEYQRGNHFKCSAYKNMKPLPQVETVSLKEALSILEAHKGVKCRIEGCE